MENSITNEAIKRQRQEADRIIREAFREHFGFEIEEVRDTDNFEHIVQAGYPISSYLYRGETFLYEQEEEIQIDPYKERPEWVQATIVKRYRKV